jgi:hypothetical protein
LAAPSLEMRELMIHFGGHVAVDSVSCIFRPGQLTAIVGPNGAGKTTYFNLMSGQLRATSGRVLVRGADVTRLSAPQRARIGIGRAFQLTNLFPGLNVIENVRLATQANAGVHHELTKPWMKLLRIVNSPFGRVLQAIREHPFRAEALGYRVVFQRTLATCLSAAGAAAAGALNALWLRYVGPDTALSFSIQIDILVIVVIGGMGTHYGAVIGAALFVLAENYLQALIGRISAGATDLGLPLLANLFHPGRWLLWLGLMFILAVHFAPTGIVGRLRARDN